MNTITPSDRAIIREDERHIIDLRRALEAKGIAVRNTSGLRNGDCEWHSNGVTFKVQRTGVGSPLAFTVVCSTLLGRPSKGQEVSTDDIVSLSEEIAEAIDQLFSSFSPW